MKADCANCPHHACYTRGANCTGVKEEEIRKAYTEEERKIGTGSGCGTPSPLR